MSRPLPSKPSSTTRNRLAILAVAVLVIAWIGGSLFESDSTEPAAPATAGDSGQPAAPEPPPTTAGADGSTQLACEHFRNVMGDVGNGLLTVPELREKTKEFYSTGQRSEISQVRTATRQMLAAITAGDTDAYMAASKRMDAACDQMGL